MEGGTIDIGINGFGRIGRTVMRVLLSRKDTAIRIRAINAPGKTAEYVCYALRYDSVFGKLPDSIAIAPAGESAHAIVVEGCTIALLDSRDPEQLDWKATGAKYVVESTGVFTTTAKARLHLGAEKGADKVIITAPAKDDTPMLVMGVNHTLYDPACDVVSMASCTTNCLAPLAHAIHERFGIEEGLMTTVHSSTGSQTTVDASPSGGKDWRAGRSALNNIIPASTGAAKAVGAVVPALKGKLTGIAVRVPTVDVSMVDLTIRTREAVDAAALHGAIAELAADPASPMFGILGVTTDPVVSQDFVGESRSCVLDTTACVSLSPHFHKLIAWYDNEWGYSSRVVDLLGWMASRDAGGGADAPPPAVGA